jgi:DNA-directed RNA polymerase specialized sigma24 family protein
MSLSSALPSTVAEGCVFPTVVDVVWALVRYTDWWQPRTGSVIPVAGARRGTGFDDGIHDGLLDTLDERSELCRRMAALQERDREILFLWYVREVPAHEIARDVGISRRQCFRRKAAALRALIDENEDAA